MSCEDDPTQTPRRLGLAGLHHAERQQRRRSSTRPPSAIGVGDQLFGVPGLHSGSVIYFYRKDLFDAAGLKPAATWDEFKAAADRAQHPGRRRLQLHRRQRLLARHGQLVHDLHYHRWRAHVGSPQTKDFKPNLTSPEAVGALQFLIDLLPYAPANVTTYGFAEERRRLLVGQDRPDGVLVHDRWAGLWSRTRWSRTRQRWRPCRPPRQHAVRRSSVAGAPGSRRTSIRPRRTPPGVCSPGSPARRPTSSSPGTTRSTPAATSTYTDPELIAQLPYLPVAGQAMDNASIIQTACLDDFFQMNADMNVEFNKALIGGQTAAEACANVQALWEASLRKAGVTRVGPISERTARLITQPGCPVSGEPPADVLVNAKDAGLRDVGSPEHRDVLLLLGPVIVYLVRVLDLPAAVQPAELVHGSGDLRGLGQLGRPG